MYITGIIFLCEQMLVSVLTKKETNKSEVNVLFINLLDKYIELGTSSLEVVTPALITSSSGPTLPNSPPVATMMVDYLVSSSDEGLCNTYEDVYYFKI